MSSQRRLIINPNTLRMVEHRAGEHAAADRLFLVCHRVTRSGRTVAASIHRTGCRRAPADQRKRADGSVWSVMELTRTGASEAVKAIAPTSRSRRGVRAAAAGAPCSEY